MQIKKKLQGEIMKKRDKGVTINTRLSIGLNQLIEDLVSAKNYESVSGLIRVAVEMLVNYHNYEDRMQEPQYRDEFLGKVKPELLMDKTESAVASYVKNLPENELEIFYYTISNERLNRKRNKENEKKGLLKCYRYGGELSPKVGYRKIDAGGHIIYRPIEPSDDEFWDNLSTDDRKYLLEELKVKRNNLHTKVVELGFPQFPDTNYFIIDGIIERISKEIEN